LTFRTACATIDLEVEFQNRRKMGEYTLEDVVDNMKWYIEQYGKATRDGYREANGTIPERFWRSYFPTFTDFIAAASIENVQDTEESVKQTLHDDKWDFTLVSRIKSLDELVKQFNVDLSIWGVERFICNSWEMGYTSLDKSAHAFPLYQVKATFALKRNIVAARQEIEDLKKLAQESAHWPVTVVKETLTSGNSLELLIPDLHAGKFAWHKETLHQDYDTPTAISTYERAVQTILNRSKGYVFDEIVLGVGNDLLNSDDYNS